MPLARLHFFRDANLTALVESTNHLEGLDGGDGVRARASGSQMLCSCNVASAPVKLLAQPPRCDDSCWTPWLEPFGARGATAFLAVLQDGPEKRGLETSSLLCAAQLVAQQLRGAGQDVLVTPQKMRCHGSLSSQLAP